VVDIQQVITPLSVMLASKGREEENGKVPLNSMQARTRQAERERMRRDWVRMADGREF
jgi:hypothetical protein